MSGRVITSSSVGSNTGLDATAQTPTTSTGASETVSDGTAPAVAASAAAPAAAAASVAYDARVEDEKLARSVYDLGVAGIPGLLAGDPSPARGLDTFSGGFGTTPLLVAALNKVAEELDLTHRVLNVKAFGAKGDGTTDDTAAIQAAISACVANGGGTVFLPSTTANVYRINSTIYITGHSVRLVADPVVEIQYYGTGRAIDVTPVVGIYPVSCDFEWINVRLMTAGTGPATPAVAFCWRFSYSKARNCYATLTDNNQRGWELLGDVGGTGPYYNRFENCGASGAALTGKTTQIGVECTYDVSTPTRCANSNRWTCGRFSGCTKGLILMGAKNAFKSVTLESTTGTAITIGHPTEPLGCSTITISDAYLEGDVASNPNAFVILTNALDTSIIDPYVTSIGTGAVYTDSGTRTKIIGPAVTDATHTLLGTKIPTKGLVFDQGGEYNFTTIYGLYPALRFKDTNGTIVVQQNGSRTSQALRLQAWSDGASAFYFMFGTTTARFMATRLEIDGGNAAIITGNGSPEGVVVAPVGSLYLRKDGGAGTSLYVKETGAGNTGWAGK